MIQQIKDGGPAFAFANGNIVSLGMTLRDYFAAAALNGLLGNIGFHVETDVESEIPNAIAKYAYEAADAMLKAMECK
jgi:hypothetical protein